jgi:DNA-binding response OmpR family regulator
MRAILATAVAGALLASAPMMTANGLQSTETFAEGQVSVPETADANEAAKRFCTQRGFTAASSYDLTRLIAMGPGMNGMAHFRSITCRSHAPVTASDGLLP